MGHLRSGGVTPYLAFLLICGWLFSARARADQYHGMNAGAPVWGGSIEFTQTKASAIAATGCRAVRVNFRLDGHTSWDAGILATYDTVITRALHNNLTVLGLFSNECMPVGQTSWNDDPDGDGMNAYVVDFSSTVLLLVDRYKTQIKRWEIWNEPNCWSVDPSTHDPRYVGCTYVLPRIYANLLAESYKQLEYNAGRSILSDYGISLVSGGLFAHEIGGSFSHAMDYMQQVYDRTAVWDWMDANAGRRYPWSLFGYHFYLATDTTITTARLDQYFNQVRDTQAANNDFSPIYVTEFGWNSASAVGETGQAQNMQIAYNHMETKSYIVGAYWYQWVDEPYPYYWGVTRGDGSLKPSHTEFTAQNQDNIPPPEPQVSIAADKQDVAVGEQVSFTPTVSLFPGISALESTWHFGADEQTVSGTPGNISWAFQQTGDYDVRLVVTDSNHLSGVSNKITVHVTLPVRSAADFDQDGDVDQVDFGHLQSCLSGSGTNQNEPACMNCLLDSDGDVDQDDFAVFQICMSGAGAQADPQCGH